MSGKRLFVSLEPPPSVAQEIVRLDPHLPGLRWVRAEQLHLTLAFLGQIGAEAEETLLAQLAAIRFTRFFLPLQGIGSFTSRGRTSVLWLGVGRGHPHLFQLHKRVIDAALAAGLEPDLRPWKPHLTLARCHEVPRPALERFLRAQADFDGGLIPIDSFQLKSSRLTPAGSLYTTELSVDAG